MSTKSSSLCSSNDTFFFYNDKVNRILYSSSLNQFKTIRTGYFIHFDSRLTGCLFFVWFVYFSNQVFHQKLGQRKISESPLLIVRWWVVWIFDWIFRGQDRRGPVRNCAGTPRHPPLFQLMPRMNTTDWRAKKPLRLEYVCQLYRSPRPELPMLLEHLVDIVSHACRPVFIVDRKLPAWFDIIIG